MSSSVRAMVVTGMPVTDSGTPRVREWCSSMPFGPVLPVAFGTVTCGRSGQWSRRSHRAAALKWLSAAPSPQAMTAARARPAGARQSPAGA